MEYQRMRGTMTHRAKQKKGDPKGLPFFVSVQNLTLLMAARYIFHKKTKEMTRASIKTKKYIRMCCGKDFFKKICGCRKDFFFMEYNTDTSRRQNRVCLREGVVE